jgi:rare lipoprotein A
MITNILKTITLYFGRLSYFLVIGSAFLIGCEEPDIESRVDFCRGRNDAYFVGGTWAPYSIFGKTYTPQKCYYYDQIGTSSWYGADFHGKKTASGQIYNQHKLTAAHRTLPIPSLIKVTNLKNKKTVVVLVTDRGPYVPGKSTRILDLSKAAFAKIANNLGEGVLQVRVQVLEEETLQLIKKMNTKLSSGR